MYEASGPITHPVDYFKSGAQEPWTLIDNFKIPGDNHLWYVLASKDVQTPEGQKAMYVSWLYNGQFNGCFHGHYAQDYAKAVATYNRRCGVKSTRVKCPK